MITHKIPSFLSKSVSLLTIQAIARQGLLQNLLNTNKSTILTTVQHESHTLFADYFSKIKSNPNIRVVPYYQPLVYQHFRQQKLEAAHIPNPRGISLLIGNSNEQILSQFDNKVVTLEQLCQTFPQKIPLSYRSRDTSECIANLQKRLELKIIKQKAINFERILMISPYIKMWDEAIQVILDYMPIPLYVPYLKQLQKEKAPYSLTVKDFLAGLQKIQKTIKMAVKDHAEPKIIVFNQRRQLDWMIGNLAPEATQMVIDRYFFTNEPKTMEAVEEDIKMPVQLQAYL